MDVSVLWLQVAFEKDGVLWILWWLVVAESTLMEQKELQSSQVSGRGEEHTSLMRLEERS